ncbi:hypothetical protein FHW84_001673 [Dyella sp. SG562]|uniref:hypothetical protein n=1 Tax=Dyella TaxID=231454 RepID=UPI001421691F|nr:MULTISPECIES: hypothetical protein [unclassified Dyella]NII73104.1 hypothetical protein [Dyella sp. SG562]NKJ19794.1 hypothetical protein [Dyella sp. SG609]
MTRLPSRLALLVLAGGLVLAGCNDKTTRPSSSGSSTTTTSSSRGTAPASTTRAPASKPKTAPSQALPDQTGIPACDNYLNTYIACHQAAAIYPADQIEGRYEAMRESLLRDSLDPDIRPQLGNRCTSLANQLHQALHGKACAPQPVVPASGGSH